MEFETEDCTLEFLGDASKNSIAFKQSLHFMIGSGVLKGCVLPSIFLNKKNVWIKNPFSDRDMLFSYKSLKIVKNFTGIYIPENVEEYYKEAKKSQEKSLDKFGGTVYLDSIVTYVDNKRSADESLRMGVVTHISKVGVVTVRDIIDGKYKKLPNSKRHLVIDENIFQRLMFLKLGKNS